MQNYKTVKLMNWQAHTEAVTRRCSAKKVFLKISQNLQKNTCARASFLTKLQAEASNFIKNETLAQVSSSEFCKNFYEHLFKRTHGGCFCTNLHLHPGRSCIIMLYQNNLHQGESICRYSSACFFH